MSFVKVGMLADFPEGKGRSVRVDGERVAVFRVRGRIRAIQDRCPHMGAWLSEGTLRGERVTCHMHDWTYDLETGACDTRSWACVKIYEVKLEGDEVWLSAPQAPTAPPQEEDDWIPWDDDFLKRKD